MECNTGKVINLSSLYTRFQGLADKRKPKGKRYALATILLGMFLAKLCGEDKPSGIAEWVALRGKWIASVLGLKRKSMPSHHTYRRTLADGVDEEECDFDKMVSSPHDYRTAQAFANIAFIKDWATATIYPASLESMHHDKSGRLVQVFGETVTITKVVAQSLQFLPDNTNGDNVVEKGKVIDEGEFELREVA